MNHGKRAGQSVVEATLLLAIFSVLVFGVGVLAFRTVSNAKEQKAITEGTVLSLDYNPAYTTTTIVGKVPVPIAHPEEYVVTVGGWNATANKAVTVTYTVSASVFKALHVGDHIQTAILAPPS